MIITKLQGGLGNQMFQYAFGKAMSLRFNKELYFDLSSFETNEFPNSVQRKYELDIFSIYNATVSKQIVDSFKNESLRNKLFRRCGLPYKKWYREILPDTGLAEELIPPIYIDGYWQSEKYFKDIETPIRNDFSWVKPLDKETNNIANSIKETNLSVSIHIRRGDYVTSTITNEFHGVCSLAYYENAVNIIRDKIGAPKFYVFSDDTDWAIENIIKDRTDMQIITHNTIDGSWKDMYLMSLCEHSIIANSSFSWWGAWLNTNKNKIVIAPEKWINPDSRWYKQFKLDDVSIVPEKWVKIPN